MPIMCVIGNPPYSGISQNKGKWITTLIEDYKEIDGVSIGERKHWLQDDYVKFIRFSEHLIEKNGEGILGFITNHGYLDNPTFRGMRWHLMQTFNSIYVLDLHGNTNRGEVAPNGATDKNVFDIQQGVAIIIAIRKKDGSTGQAKVHHADLWGSREEKHKLLYEGNLKKITKSINCVGPQFAFVKRDYSFYKQYAKGFSINKFMPTNVTGIVTARDGLVIDFSRKELQQKIEQFIDPSTNDDVVRSEFFSNRRAGNYPAGDTRGWKLGKARKSLQIGEWQSDIKAITYRPFDTRAILYRKDMVDWGRFDMMSHMLNGENYALIFSRQAVRSGAPPVNVLLVDTIFDNRGIYSNRGISQAAPLYLYPYEHNAQANRMVNFEPKLYEQLRQLAKRKGSRLPNELQTMDYIYGVLHCPEYREMFTEFLKTDFPRIPWPSSPDEFWDVSKKGQLLRKLHLMNPSSIGKTPYTFIGEGDNIVSKVAFKKGKIWINENQHFDKAPDVSWNLYMGGYQPAQKWLKDRKGHKLKASDLLHYQKILKILSETDRIMQTITMNLGSDA